MKNTGSNSLHVLFVISSLRRGGAERVVSILANHWAANGRIVTIVTLNHGPEDTGYELHPDVRHHRFQRRQRAPSLLMRLLKKINRIRSRLQVLTRIWLLGRVVQFFVAVAKKIFRVVKKMVMALTGAVIYSLRYLRRKTAILGQHSWDHQFQSRLMERAMLAVYNFLPSPMRWEITLIDDMRVTIDDIKPDVIISFLTGTNIRTMRAAQPLGIPIILSERTAPSRPFPQMRQYIEARKKWYPGADCLIVQTSEAAAHYDEIMQGKLQVIPNPVLPPAQQYPQSHDERNSIIAIGRMVHEKGYDRLLAAYKKVFHLHPSWTLEIWGDGPLGETLEKLIGDYHLQDCVKLMGTTNEIGRELAHADIFVMTSRYEGFPNALCEAMASGLPSVVFDCPVGPRAIIKDGVNGLLVENDNIDAFANTLSELMVDSEQRRKLGKHALEVLDDYSLDHVAGLWDTVIDKQCNQYAST